jgi:hypothetical protein
MQCIHDLLLELGVDLNRYQGDDLAAGSPTRSMT